LGSRSAYAKPAITLGTWTQQWADEFNGSGAVSSTNWIYDLGHGYSCGTCANWGTGEIENTTNSTANVNQTGGHLAIIPLRDASGNWTSGRIETQRTDFQPPVGGAMAIEASIQQPNVSGAAAQGYWPAFWALGAPFRGVYTNWPGIGELDVLEDVNGQSNVFGTIHCGVSPGGPCNETTGIGSGAHACTGCQTGYHTYRIEFDRSVSPEQLRWYLDGANYFTVNASQVDATTWANATNHGFFIILNLAMGGGWPGNPTASTTPGVPMNVDYVRVFYANAATGPTATRSRTPTAGPTATNTPIVAGDFSQSATKLNTTQAKITFVSNVSSTFVDVHYTGAPGLGQQNFRMAQNGNTWTQTVSNLTSGTVLTYWFTYQKAGLAYDSAHFTYTH
jgi:beta-glucanase (GH16 family)